MPRTRYMLAGSKHSQMSFMKGLFILGCIIGAIWLLYNHWQIFTALALLVLMVYFLFHLKKIIKGIKHLFGRKNQDWQTHLLLVNALKVMDTTYHYYTNENEATRELVSCLKAQGHDAEYQPYLGNGRTADAFVNGAIIEGKLSPDGNEVDRLFGQIAAYLHFRRHIHIVIYGHLDSYAKNRIEQDIVNNYPKKVTLTYLNNPKRLTRDAVEYQRQRR